MIRENSVLTKIRQEANGASPSYLAARMAVVVPAGMAEMITQRTEIPCRVADDADSCVANGCGRSLKWLNSMQEGTINLARRKLMRD